MVLAEGGCGMGGGAFVSPSHLQCAQRKKRLQGLHVDNVRSLITQLVSIAGTVTLIDLTHASDRGKILGA